MLNYLIKKSLTRDKNQKEHSKMLLFLCKLTIKLMQKIILKSSNKINSNLLNIKPVLLFNGAKSLSEDIAWNPDIAFSSFTKVNFCMTFQGQRHFCAFFPVSATNEKGARHSFSWSDFSNDGAFRIITGRISFAGRYIDQKKVAMSINLSGWVELAPSNIIVEKIIGYI